MANINGFLNVDNLDYCGKEAQEIFAKDVYSLDLRDYGITLMDGVKGRTKLYTGEIGDVWQAYTCPFTPEGEASLGEWEFEPVAIKVNMEECYDKFWNTFLVEQTSISLNGGIPATFSEWFFSRLRQKMAKEYQEIFWKGDSDNSGSTYLSVTDGVEKQLEDNTGVTKIAGARFTVDNVLSQVEAAISAGIDNAANADVNVEGYKVMLNKADVKLLEVALGKLCCGNSKDAIFANYAKENGRIYVMGFEIVPTEQSRNTVIFGPIRNLVLGFDTFDSHLMYKLVDLRNSTLDNAFRIAAISNIAVGIVFPELFVYSRVA